MIISNFLTIHHFFTENYNFQEFILLLIKQNLKIFLTFPLKMPLDSTITSSKKEYIPMDFEK